MAEQSVDDVLKAIADPVRQQEARALDALFRQTTDWSPVNWGRGQIGYGKYHYKYASGREEDALATGFLAQSSRFSLYIMPGYAEFPEIAARLGPHKRGKACWYITRVSKVDTDALADLIRAGLADLGTQFPVEPT